MKFREWKRLYKQQRQDAVPDLHEVLNTAREQVTSPVKVFNFRSWQRVAALAASVAIIIGVGGYIAAVYQQSDIPTLTPDATTTTNTVTNQAQDTTTVQTTTKVAKKTNIAGSTIVTKPTTSKGETASYVLAISLNYRLPLYLTGAVDKYATAHTVRLRSDLLSGEHQNCMGVSYDTEQQKIVCPQHTVMAMLSKKNVSATSAYIHAYHPTYKTVFFTLTKDDKSSYFYDMNTDTLKKLSISLYQCPGNVNVQSNTPYVVLWRGGGNNDIYALQMQTGEIINILQDKNGKYLGTPMDDAKLSTCGKYAIYTLGEGDDPNGPGRTTVLYTFATKQIAKFTGEVCEELPEMACLLLNTPKGYVKYDIAKGTTTPLVSSDIPKQYHKYVRQCDTDLSPECYRLMLCDRLTGKETLLCEDFIYAYSYSPDRRYLYYYIRGEKHIRARNLRTNTDSVIQLDVSPAEQTEGEELKDRALLFSLACEGENEIILLYANSGSYKIDPEEERAYKERFPDYTLRKMEQAGEVTSIVALESLLRRFPTGLVAFEGNGFLCLDYTPLTISDETGIMVSNRQVLMEDYNSRATYDICHSWKDYTSEFTGKRVGTLSANAQNATRRLLEELGIPIKPAPRDYRPYFSEDAQVVMKQHLADLSADVVASRFNCYYIYISADNYDGSRRGLDSTTQKQEFLEFMRFTDTLSYRKVDPITPYVNTDCTYMIRFSDIYHNTLDMYLGCHQGQYYFTKKGYVATITAEQYNRWKTWLDAKAKESYMH